MTSANVVQSAGGNVGAVPAPAVQMGLGAGEVLGMRATGSGRVPGVGADRTGPGAVAVSPDMESAVLQSQCVDFQGTAVSCHTPRHKLDAGRAAGAGAGAAGEIDQGGRGGRERGAERPTIGFHRTENFHSAVPVRCPQCLISSCFDCFEVPCGWPEKKKGGAA